MDKIRKSEAEWRAELGDELTFAVTRQAATERAFSHPLGRPGAHVEDGTTFACVCCGAPLFEAEEKFESGCGWPSFSAPVSGTAIEERADLSHGMRRTEVRCARCEAHLGHVFNDGPGPNGLRYCINGVALEEEPPQAS